MSQINDVRIVLEYEKQIQSQGSQHSMIKPGITENSIELLIIKKLTGDIISPSEIVKERGIPM